MGGVAALLEKLPGPLAAKAGALPQGNERDITRQIAIIRSMTPRERDKPSIINGSRRERIAMGAGVQVYDVNQLLKQFTQAQKMIKQMQVAERQGKRGKRRGGFFPGMPGGF